MQNSSGLKRNVATQPSRTRYRVAGLLLLLAGVTYLDRACISILAPQISADLGLTKVQMSFVFSAFAMAYAAFEVPTAWWGERIGARRILTRIVVWWSCFTMFTAFAWNYVSMLVIRFAFGAGEAGAWPSAALAFSRWTPVRERGRTQGLFFAAAHLSGGLTPLLVATMSPILSWRTIFVVCGLVGLVWSTVWYRWFRDEPRDHPRVNAAEAKRAACDSCRFARVDADDFITYRSVPLVTCPVYRYRIEVAVVRI